MKFTVSLLLILLSNAAFAQDQNKEKTPYTVKGVLLFNLKRTHNVKDWFVPANVAVQGLTPEQASWSDGKGNHSVGQLTYHLVFWDRYSLAKFKGEQPEKFSGKNDDTFNNFDPKKWNDLVKQLDDVMTEWEKAVEAADDAKLKDNFGLISNVAAHNAYHIGEIVMVRKEQGAWNPENGVK
jgi:uncharacterized damage-inducible protein DinB